MSLTVPVAPPLDFQAPALNKRATFSIGSPHPTSPTSANMSPGGVGEVRGWFSNLFHWKVQTLVLYSVLDLATTRSEIVRLLEGFGITVAVEEGYKNGLWSANGNVLLCRADEAIGGSSSERKLVRFRVEFTAAGSPRGPAPGYDTAIGIALEKGSVSTFKGLCQRLRTEWRLDALMSPVVGAPPMGIQQQFMV